MNKEALIKLIKEKAKRDKVNRRDPRFQMTMGFLVSKGFLQTNYAVPRLPNVRLRIDDAIWAGIHVEARILEVLPAAVLRLEKHFDFNPIEHKELARTIQDLREQKDKGQDFLGMPYKKLKPWVNLKLKDGRTKKLNDKKIVKTFRFKPGIVEKIRILAAKSKITETALIEKAVLAVDR
jgi:hypothetical protein